MKKEAGFTLVEILAVVVLLGLLLSLIWNVMVQNAFQQKRVENEIDVNDSAKALLNHISDVVMEQNTPIVSKVNGVEYIKDTEYNGEFDSIEFRDGKLLKKESDNKYILDGKEYNYIKEVRIKISSTGRGLTATVIGDNDKAKVELSSTFYTRNT